MVGMNRTRAALENLVIVAIILVLIQTFVEDLAVLAGWSWAVRRVLLFTGFAFDVFFSIEFLTRLYFSFINRKSGVYFWYERGWIDFLASIPLLLLSSGPAVIAYWSGSATVVGFAALLNVLKVVKAIRIARILRLLRVLKIFARIRHTESAMAQRHVAKISTVAVTVVVVSILVVTVVFSLFTTPSLENEYQQRTVRVLSLIGDIPESAEAPATIASIADVESSLLLVKRDGRAAYSRFSNEVFDRQYGPTDYGFGESSGWQVFFDLTPLNAEQSRANLMYFVIIIFIVFAFMFYYSPHFALTISDPIHIMRRGMSEKGYNLEIKIPPLYEEDEVYKLGRLFNEVYLPMKDRTSGGDETEVLDLKMDDIKDILND